VLCLYFNYFPVVPAFAYLFLGLFLFNLAVTIKQLRTLEKIRLHGRMSQTMNRRNSLPVEGIELSQIEAELPRMNL
jgi:hypothetical protein